MKQIQEKHFRELSELRHAKATEIQSLSNRLMERTEANSALSSELRESRRLAEVHESKLRTQMTEDRAKMEKVAHQEKVSIYIYNLYLSYIKRLWTGCGYI